ncbi:MAG: hypothetical protein KAT00_01540 [Planctomycetes bacterium]|nr:hypothetical protein [Planctomycetota bacterium]
MATIHDIYRITSKASLSGLKAATKAVKGHGTSIAAMARKAAVAAAKVTRAAFSIKNLGRMAGGAVRGIGALTRGLGVLMAGGLLLVIGALRLLPGLFAGMRTAMEGATGAAGGAAANLDDVSAAAEGVAEGVSQATDEVAESAEKIEGIYGAFGAVGEGFIQAQGRVFDRATETAEAAVESAEAASEAMEDYETSVGGATQSTSRFGKALDRISSAFDKAKTKIFKAIAKAITPALEKLADLLESPAFEKFVDLLAKDLAKAAEKVAKWFTTKVIPAIEDLMEKIEDAGGPIEFIKQKFQEWKRTALMVLGIIVGKVLIVSNDIRNFFRRAIDSIKLLWLGLKLSIIATLNSAAIAAQNIMAGMSLVIRGAFNSILESIETVINAAIRVINPFLALYNKVADATGGRKIDMIEPIILPRLAKGAIVSSPIFALVGDAPSPEVVAPLDDLRDILRDVVGTTTIGSIQIIVSSDPGGLSPMEAGRQTADSFIETMRRRGLQLSVR